MLLMKSLPPHAGEPATHMTGDLGPVARESSRGAPPHRPRQVRPGSVRKGSRCLSSVPLDLVCTDRGWWCPVDRPRRPHGRVGDNGADARTVTLPPARPPRGRRGWPRCRWGTPGASAIGLGKRIGGAPAETVMTEIQQRTAEQLFRTLGELKGGAMKFGQALSVLEAALPDEVAAPYREHLTRLQDSAPPMPTQTVRDLLDQGPRCGLARPAGLARRRPDRGRVDRAGAQGALARRPRRRGQGAVPGRRRGADVRPHASSPGWPGPSGRWCPASTSSR